MFGDTIAGRRDSAGRQKPAGTADLWQERGNPMGKALARPANNVVGVFLWVFPLAPGDGPQAWECARRVPVACGARQCGRKRANED